MSFKEQLKKTIEDREQERLAKEEAEKRAATEKARKEEQDLAKEAEWSLLTEKHFNPIFQEIIESYLEGKGEAKLNSWASLERGCAELRWDYSSSGLVRVITLKIDAVKDVSVSFGDNKYMIISNLDQSDWQEKIQNRIAEGLRKDECLITWDPDPGMG